MAKKIMAWSKCKIEIGTTGSNDAMCEDASLEDVGVILNQSSTLSAEAGDKMQAIATGGEVVAEEPQEGTLTLETTIIEPTQELIELLGIGIANDDTETIVKTHVVEGDWSVKVTPKNQGAWGIKAPKCSIAYTPSWSEESGHQAVLTITILKTTEVQTILKKKGSSSWTTVTSGTPTGYVMTEADLPANAATDTIYAVGFNYWYSRFKTASSL